MFELLLGHLVGDYLLQTSWMAKDKAQHHFHGWLAATVHCLVYTASVMVIMNNYDIIWGIAVFLSHFFIDKFSLGEVWMKYVKGYSLKEFYDNRKKRDHEGNYRPLIVQGGFITLVYTLTDNTMHLLLMWGAYNLIY